MWGTESWGVLQWASTALPVPMLDPQALAALAMAIVIAALFVSRRRLAR